jgi:rhamnose utilization protein RhaD (predicted bifunctional aldolase and dehydrogenase)
VGGENCIEARNLMKKIVNRCSVKTKSMDYKISSSLEELAANLKMRLPKHDEVHAIALNDVFYDYCTNETGILYPDQAVFLGPSMPCYRGELDHKNFVDFVKQYEKSPFLIIKGKGVLVANDAKIDVDEMLRCHVRVLSHIPNESKLNYLTGIEVARLLDWEPEKYRLSLEE